MKILRPKKIQKGEHGVLTFWDFPCIHGDPFLICFTILLCLCNKCCHQTLFLWSTMPWSTTLVLRLELVSMTLLMEGVCAYWHASVIHVDMTVTSCLVSVDICQPCGNAHLLHCPCWTGAETQKSQMAGTYSQGLFILIYFPVAVVTIPWQKQLKWEGLCFGS